MLLKDAEKIIHKKLNIAFKDLFTPSQLMDICKNKGKSGQLTEFLLGKPLDNGLLDFEDGELKTFKCSNKKKKSTSICVTQISSDIENLIDNSPFKESHLYQKLNNVLFVGIVKNGPPTQWYISLCLHISSDKKECKPFYQQLEKDYNDICNTINSVAKDNNKLLHTTNGKIIQIRTKDSRNQKNKKYHPIFSDTYNRYISNKNFAFYIKGSTNINEYV